MIAGWQTWVLAGACALAGAAQASDVVLTLKPEVLLTQPHMILADVAEVSSDDTAQQQAWRQLPLGRVPLAGRMEQRTRAELDMVLHAQPLAPGHRIVWRGADSVRVQSASQMLDSALLLTLAQQQLRQAFAAPGLTLEIRLAAPLAELVAPPGALQYQARLADATRLHARMAVWIDVLAQDAVYRSVLVPLAVQAWREAYVARRALPAGALLAPADVELRREDVAGLAEAALAPGALASGGRLRQALEAGQIVTTRQVAGGDMVLRGDRVRLVSHGAGIAVETSAMAQADAVVGQQVRVKPDRSNETVQAWVIAPGLVSMEGR